MTNILKKIFSVEEYNETHKKVTILGVKLKYPKYEYRKLKSQNPFYEYKNNNVDITTIPPAKGQIREIQLANLALLKEFDYVCKQNNLKYWLDFGSLLGAIRHKGFIPWDDDIDVSMMREDYEKIIESFVKTSRNKDIYAEQIYLGKSQTIIKVKHRKCPHLFLDIFPHDYTNSRLNKSERIKKTKALSYVRKLINNNKNLKTSNDVIDYVKAINKEIIPDKFVERSDIQCGLEYSYTEPLWIHSYETIFPTKEVEFEGFKVMVVNKPEEYLTDIFGDYMAYPKKIGFGHSMYLKLSDDEKNIIRKLAGNV